VQEEVVKSPDWIQELYLKELMYKSINNEKAHETDRTVEQGTKGTSTKNRRFPGQLQPPRTKY